MNIHLSHLKIYNFNIHIILTIVLGRPESSSDIEGKRRKF